MGKKIIFVYVQCSCVLKFDGASKGNPGLAGAGAVLLAEDGSMVCISLIICYVKLPGCYMFIRCDFL